ncbi:uncharacterized protein CBL_01461 [Carabus blaptoides fortunei]
MSQVQEIKDLKSLLEYSFGKDVDVLSYETKRLTAPGENYGSLMLAVDVKLKINNTEPITKHLVAKLRPESELLCTIFNIQETFKKELHMYTLSVPALAKLEEEYGIKDNKVSDMFATCFGGRINLKPGSEIVDEDAVLLLDNLKVSGYDVGDRLTGFDMDHAELIIKNLAKYHGAFVALKYLKPNVFEEKVYPSIKQVKLGGDMDTKAIENFTSEVVEVLEKDDKCILYIEKLLNSMKFHLEGEYRKSAPENPFSTAVHTDYWVNNTMLLWDQNGKPIHNKIVDWQMPTYNSGVYDLLFFIFTSVMPSVLYDNVDHFFKLYYDHFIDCLKQYKLDVSPFSWEAFSNDIKIIAPIELGHILCMYKPILTMRGEIKDMASFDEDSISQKLAVTNDYEKRVIKTALYFINKGWI